MTGFPTRDEMLNKEPYDLAIFLDSVLGPGYEIILQLSKGLRWRGRPGEDISPLFEIVEDPPIFPVRFKIAHIKGQDMVNVRWEIKVRGSFVTFDHSVYADCPKNISYDITKVTDVVPWGSVVVFEDEFNINNHYDFCSINEFAEAFLVAAKANLVLKKRDKVKEKHHIELVATTSSDLSEAAKATMILEAKIKRLQEMHELAKRRIQLLALGEDPDNR